LRSVRRSARKRVGKERDRRPKRAVGQTPFKLRRKILNFAEKESFITNYNAVVRIRNKHFWKITIICIKTARTKRQNRKKK
jgi:hypothetical protein